MIALHEKPTAAHELGYMSGACSCLLCSSKNICILQQLSTSDLTRCYEPALRDVVAQNFHGCPILSYCRCKDCDLRYFSPPVTGSQDYYEALQRYAWYYMEDKPEYQSARKWFSTQDRVLEIGCGSGAFSRHIDVAQYTGLEFNPKAVRSASQRGLNIHRVSVEEHIRQHGEQYDIVCSFQVLEHVTPIHSFIAASVKALRVGGILICCVPSEDSYVSLLQNAILNLPPHHITRWTDSALKSIASLFPLELIAIEHEPLAEFHRDAYTSLLALQILDKLLHRERNTALLDFSCSQRLLKSVANRLGRILQKGFDDPKLLPQGHSVTAVFRKKLSHSLPGPAVSRGEPHAI